MFTPLKNTISHVRFKWLTRFKKPFRERDWRYRFTDHYFEVAGQDPSSALRLLDSSDRGLTPTEVARRLEEVGPNQVAQEHKIPPYIRLLKTFRNPFNILLSIIAAISFLTDDMAAGVIVSAMVVLSVFLTFFQEYRSSQAAEKLRTLVTTAATVYRRPDDTEASDSLRQEVPIQELVPGDVIHLSAGDMIPADVRIISSKDLFVSQATLTGEAIPVEKQAINDARTQGFLDLKNIGFMGSSVVSGTAIAVVMKTGGDTYFGSLAKTITGERVLTSFDKGIHKFTWLMIRFMLVMVPLVFVINGLSKGNWLEAFLFAVSVAVGLTPEMLPMILTVNLAKGAILMSRKKVIVKRLNSIQNFGAMDVLCTDKTGTLTLDRVTLLKWVDPFGMDDDRVLRYAYLNSYHQSGLKNLLDKAVLEHVEVKQSLQIDIEHRKVDEIPFDFVRRRMSVVVEEQGAAHVLICKGALEEMFKVSARAYVEGALVPIDAALRARMEVIARELNNDGLRVIAVSYKEILVHRSAYIVTDESDLILLGFIAFLDPPKETAAQAIEALNRAGVRVIVLTGDNEVVTRKICKEVGLSIDRAVLGSEVEEMNEAALSDLAERAQVFVKLTPALKERVIRALHRRGHVVGFLGDGINDAPALKAADVGISVDTAVDIAKESADIILLEKNLLVLEEGVIEGRKVFGNIVKYVKMGASSNFGNVFSVVGASLLLPFLPMAPVQLLFQNLLYDLSQTAIPFDQVDEEYLSQPRRWQIADISRFMLYLGPVSSLFDYATFALMWFVFRANTVGMQSLFQSGWFVEGLLSQTLIVHMIRTPKVPFLQSRASWPLLATTAAVMAVGIYIPFSSLGRQLGFAPLPLRYFPWLVGMLLSYALLAQVVKSWFVKRFGFN